MANGGVRAFGVSGVRAFGVSGVRAFGVALFRDVRRRGFYAVDLVLSNMNGGGGLRGGRGECEECEQAAAGSEADAVRASSGGRQSLARRELLAGVGVAGVASLTGCIGGSGDANESTGSGNEVVVGPDGQYSFSPASLSVAVGETVRWRWDSANHNIVVDQQPDDADWTGTDGDASKTYGEGHTYEYTFETPGAYDYFCQPHASLGMRATVVVE
jgi:plastocyanin